MSSDKELVEYIDTKSFHEWLNEIDRNWIAELFSKYKDIIAIPVTRPKITDCHILTVNRVEICSKDDSISYSFYTKLKQKGVNICVVRIPSVVKNVYGPFCTMSLTEPWMKDPGIQKVYESDIHKITKLSLAIYTEQVLGKLVDKADERQFGEQDKTIYLAGPCLVTGYSASEVTLTDALYELLQIHGCEYRIIKINSRYFANKLLEYNICQNDIVIFVGTGLKYFDHDLTYIYEEYEGLEYLCTDTTMHVSKTGCELIANAIMEDIILPYYKRIDVRKDKEILHHAERNQLRADVEYEVKMYLKRTGIPMSARRGNNGAIVMNANPFTLGH